MDGWLDELKGLTIIDVAPVVGLSLHKNPKLGGVDPCPCCGATSRGSTDPRGAVRVDRGFRLWHCKKCNIGGDVVKLLAYAAGAIGAGGAITDYKRLAEWSSARGLVRANHKGNGAKYSGGVRSPARGAPVAPVQRPAFVAPEYPPQHEVNDVWARCVPLHESPELLHWLGAVRGREPFQIERLCERDVVRALQKGTKLPEWATKQVGKSLRTWADLGYWCVVPLYDSGGVMRSLLARGIAPSLTPKSLGARGFDRAGLIMADGLALRLLRGGTWPGDVSGGVGIGRLPPNCVYILEGEMSYAAAVVSYATSDGADFPAVFGCVAGSLTPEVLARVPDGSVVVFGVDRDHGPDDVDRNGKPDKGARALISALRDGLSERLRNGRLTLNFTLVVDGVPISGGAM